MTDPAEIVPAEVWPPPPTLPPPAGPRWRIWLLRFPLWAVVLVDAGIGVGEFGITCLRRWATHHAIQWTDAGMFGVSMFVMFLTLHLWGRAVMLKREQEATE